MSSYTQQKFCLDASDGTTSYSGIVAPWLSLAFAIDKLCSVDYMHAMSANIMYVIVMFKAVVDGFKNRPREPIYSICTKLFLMIFMEFYVLNEFKNNYIFTWLDI